MSELIPVFMTQVIDQLYTLLSVANAADPELALCSSWQNIQCIHCDHIHNNFAHVAYETPLALQVQEFD